MRVPGYVLRVASWSLIAGFLVGIAMSAAVTDPLVLESEAYGRIAADVAVAEVVRR